MVLDPFRALLGGALIGLAAALLLLTHGRIAGVSGILGGVLTPRRGDTAWRLAFLLGLVATGAVLSAFWPARFSMAEVPHGALLGVAGLLVGFGSRIGGGCTSGHGVCGLGRGSPRSLAATAVFMATAMLTVLLVRPRPMSSAAALSGALFACGLALAGMTEPARVLGFLDVAGDWDATLAFVMAGALLVYAALYRVITSKLTRPLLSDAFHVPPRGRVDAKLWLGAALFGVGWGLSGLCPGPAIVALGAGKGEALLFMVCMLAGAGAASLLTPHLSARGAAVPEALASDDA